MSQCQQRNLPAATSKSGALGAAGATLNLGLLQRIAVMSGGKVAYLTAALIERRSATIWRVIDGGKIGSAITGWTAPRASSKSEPS